MNAASNIAKVSLVDNITKGGYKWNKKSDAELTLTYSFMSPRQNDGTPSYDFTNLSSFTNQEKSATIHLLQKIAQFTGLEFRMAAAGERSNLIFANYSDAATDILGFAYLPVNYEPGVGSTPIWMNAAKLKNIEKFESVLSHEIGHALGLNHVSTDGSFSYKESVMWPYHSSNQGLQVADQDALKKLYGHDTYWPRDFYHSSVTSEDIKNLYDNTTDAAQKKSVLEFWHQLHQSEYKFDVQTLTSSQKNILTALQKPASPPPSSEDSCRSAVAYEDIKNLYDNTTDAAQKKSVMEFWRQLHQSEYKVDVQTLTASQKDILKAATTNQQLENMIVAMSGMDDGASLSGISQVRPLEINSFFVSNCTHPNLG